MADDSLCLKLLIVRSEYLKRKEPMILLATIKNSHVQWRDTNEVAKRKACPGCMAMTKLCAPPLRRFKSARVPLAPVRTCAMLSQFFARPVKLERYWHMEWTVKRDPRVWLQWRPCKLNYWYGHRMQTGDSWGPIHESTFHATEELNLIFAHPLLSSFTGHKWL